MMDEIETLWRRVRGLALLAPVLLLVGFGAGEIANRVLEVPEDKAVRFSTGKEVPQPELDAIAEEMLRAHAVGAETVDYVAFHREHVEPVEKVLRRRGISVTMARKLAWPVVEESYRRQLDPATVISVLLVESGGKPTARSPVGARGLMQVMPFWAGHWRECGKDLFDIQDNICNGTSILQWYLSRHGDERSALLGYNGCVRGTNTPNCFIYPDKIWNLRQQIKRELTMYRPRPIERSGD